MNMSEFNNQNNDDREGCTSSRAMQTSLPADFNEDDLDFARELNTLFSPQDEELPPYYVQTLMAADDPRYQPADQTFAQKTSVRVFRSLELRRRLFPARRSPIASIGETIREALSRKVILAWAAAFVLLMMCTVAFTAPSFERGMTILLQGARSGILRVHHYPSQVKHPLGLADVAYAAPPRISLFAAQNLLHFKMSWPQSLPAGYTLSAMNIYEDPGNTWADGPVLELVYSLPDPGGAKGTGQIVIREFLPQQDVLQVVQDGAAHPIEVDQNGDARAIYVQGEWLPRGKFNSSIWSSVGRRELIFQQNGVVFWIAGDQRDGINQNVLWSIAQSIRPVAFLHGTLFKQDSVTLLQADDSANGPFANDVLAIFPSDGVDGPYYLNVSSYIAGINNSLDKTVSHGH
jgi:hypothetical protein